MASQDTNAEEIALQALAWTLSDDDRAHRLLGLTGIDPETLRERAGEPALLVAVLDFLLGHEPDLIACAEALAMTPAALAAIRDRIDR